MNKNKALVLIDNNDNGFFPSSVDNANIETIYKSNSKAYRIFRKIVLKFNLPFKKCILGKWSKIAEDFNTIILFDTGNAKYLLRYLLKEYKEKRIILWFWNSVEKTINPNEINRDNVELWSFDPYDCEKYHMNYNTQFFVKENISKINVSADLDKHSDVFFVGTDKGRFEALMQLKEKFDEKSISYNYHIVGEKNESSEWEYKSPITYMEILTNDYKSKAVLDIVSQGQRGLTLRPLEALYLEKKLITNFKRIVEYDLYCKENVFILGVDSVDSIDEFISATYVKRNTNELKEKYSMEQWIKRFNMEAK